MNKLRCLSLNDLDRIVREERAWQGVAAKYVVGQCTHFILGSRSKHHIDSLMRAIENSILRAASSAIK
jgi:hypothetical protein